MNDQVKSQLPAERHDTAGPRHPLRKWWEPSPRFNQESGLLPPLELGGPWRTDWLQRAPSSACWPWYSAGPLAVPHICQSLHPPDEYKWRVSLDVSHFSPSEISLSVKGGFLQVGGRHGERADEHGSIARCFTRKYRLPAEIDATKIVSSLSVDGILTVEAPAPEPSIPATIIIPIKVEIESTVAESEKRSDPEAPTAEGHDDGCTSGELQAEDKREEETSEKSDLAMCGDQEDLEHRKDIEVTAEVEDMSQYEEADASKSSQISQEPV